MPPVIAGIATSYDDDRPAVAAFRKAAVAVRAQPLEALSSAPAEAVAAGQAAG